MARLPPLNVLLSTYWTMGAVRHGDHIAKVRFAPAPASAEAVEQRVIDVAADPDAYRRALAMELKQRPFEFELQVQLCMNLDLMPVQDVTVEWMEAFSPFVTVAKVRLPAQDISGDENLEKMAAGGVDRVLLMLPPAGADETLPRVERYAELAARHR